MLLSDVCRSDVCLSGTSGLTREQSGLGRLKVAQWCPRHTWLGHHFRGQKVKVTRPLWLVVLSGQHGHTVMVTYPYAYMTYSVSPLAGLGGGISWRPPAYSLLILLLLLVVVVVFPNSGCLSWLRRWSRRRRRSKLNSLSRIAAKFPTILPGMCLFCNNNNNPIWSGIMFRILGHGLILG